MGTERDFGIEVLSKGAEACLPANLNDYWLGILADQTNSLLSKDGDMEGTTNLVSATILVLMGKEAMKNDVKSADQALEIELEEIRDSVEKYAIEIGLEELFRTGRILYNQATLGTILEDRDLEITDL